jgi:capsular polysaccharide biosynthesis protein
MNQDNKVTTTSDGTLQRAGTNPRQQSNVQQIDLVELALMLLDNLHYLVLFFLIGAVIFNAYSYFFIHPTYQSTASIYIVSASGGTVVDLTDLNIGSSLKSDYRELILSYPVLDRVSKKLDLDWTTGKMLNSIKITNPVDTRLLKLTATAETPELAMDIANTLAEVAVDYLPETMSTEAPNIAQRGRLPDRKANPSYTRYTLLGGFLCAMLCSAWFIFKSVNDETIRTPEEMERFFGAPPLTTIPYVGAFEQNSQRRGKRSRFFYRRNKDIISSKRSEETANGAKSSSKTGRTA